MLAKIRVVPRTDKPGQWKPFEKKVDETVSATSGGGDLEAIVIPSWSFRTT